MFGVENKLPCCTYQKLSVFDLFCVLSLLPPFRQGYGEDYPRPNRSAYEEYYANYYKYMGKRYYNFYLFFCVYMIVCEIC